MLSRSLVLFLTAMSFVAGQSSSKEVKVADACVPPPNAGAPKLPARILEGQGTVHFPITTKNPEAQRFFDQGIAQMHSFWALEAERSFLQAAELDPDAPMPWFGVAMVASGDYRPRFQIDAQYEWFGRKLARVNPRAERAARKAQELAAIPGRATELEKLYIDAVAARRLGDIDKADDRFVGALRALLAKYPKEVEARSYLALMIMRGFVLPDKKPRESGSTEAVAILKQLLVEAPEHPGVHHYVIHGWEGSSFAQEAWPSCKRYTELVPNIPHALHMPGHIYSQTGRWADAIAAFDAAGKNELGYMRADKTYGNAHHGHNIRYLVTAYAFSGDYDKAISFAQHLIQFGENPREKQTADIVAGAYAQGWFGMLSTLVHFEKWDEVLDGKLLPAATKARQQVWTHYARALAFSARKNVPEMESEIRLFRETLMDLEKAMGQRPSGEFDVAKAELEAQLEITRGNLNKGFHKLQSAAIAERRLRYAEPPIYPRPIYESLGKQALRHGRSDLAERAFRRALEQFPGSSHAQAGLRAARGEASSAGAGF